MPPDRYPFLISAIIVLRFYVLAGYQSVYDTGDIGGNGQRPGDWLTVRHMDAEGISLLLSGKGLARP